MSRLGLRYGDKTNLAIRLGTSGVGGGVGYKVAEFINSYIPGDAPAETYLIMPALLATGIFLGACVADYYINKKEKPPTIYG